jgi:hypothetical protein
MESKKSFVIAVVLISLASFACANSLQSDTVATLTPTETIPVPGASLDAIIGFPRCDLDGDIYIHQPRHYGDTQPPGFLRVSADGKQTTVFSPSAVADPALKGSSFADFAVALNGVVYALIQTPGNETYVVEFKDNGQLYSSTRLVTPTFYAQHLAVFPSGEFLVTGVRAGPEGQMAGEPFTAIFDASGQIIKQVVLPGDVKPGATTVRDTGRLESSTGAAVGLGESVPSEDGNMYVARSLANPVVYVVSPGGDVLRKMVLPAPQKGLRPGSLKVSGGTLAVEFFSLGDTNQTNLDLVKQTHIYSVFDARTGEKLVDYGESPKLRGAFACYSPSYFSFVGEREGRSYILHATPK